MWEGPELYLGIRGAVPWEAHTVCHYFGKNPSPSEITQHHIGKRREKICPKGQCEYHNE